MFDFEEIVKKNVDKIFLFFNLDEDPIYTKGFKRFIKWFAYKFSPAFLSFVSFILLITIFNRIYTNYGIEKLFIIVSVIVIFSLRSINNGIKKMII